MDDVDWAVLTTSTRARVYLLWAIMLPIGFVATYFYPYHLINALWMVIAAVGLGYMYKVMLLRVPQMRKIFLAWLVPIAVGMVISGAVFYVPTHLAQHTLAHLGTVWLVVMAIGYTLNGLVDRPSGWYWFAAVLNAVAAYACYEFDAFVDTQYLIIAIVSAWSMLNLWLFRADV